MLLKYLNLKIKISNRSLEVNFILFFLVQMDRFLELEKMIWDNVDLKVQTGQKS